MDDILNGVNINALDDAFAGAYIKEIKWKEWFIMIFIAVILVAAITASALFTGDNKAKVMNEYCKLECKQNILKKHKFCC